MTKVLIADDHAIVRAGIRRLIDDHSSMEVSSEASDGNEVLKFVDDQTYDIIVLDINMPNLNGLDTLKELRNKQPNTPVLVLSMYPESQYAIRALRSGASGYLTKEAAPENLIQAIEKIVSGGRYITPELAEQLAYALGSNEHKQENPHQVLSDREYQIMCAIASGKSVSEIGKELNLSVKTISTYRTRVFDKMGFENNAQLTHYVIKNNLLL